jgi:uroporphyrinogen decarboxylase
MTERERFIAALKREKISGLVPHFELVFFLTMEVLGKVHPSHRAYSQWNQMSPRERQLHRVDIAHCFIDTAEKYNHSAIFVHPNPGGLDETVRLLEIIREISGDKYFLMMHGDPTYSMPDGNNMHAFTEQIYEQPEKLKANAARSVEGHRSFVSEIVKRGNGRLLDGIALCSDYCFNVNPFFTPDMFADLIAPYLCEIIKDYHDMGLFAIKHTDGNIMPIIDQMAECKPDAFHSLDPQGGVDLAEVKRLYGDRITLIGNVNCGLLQTGTDEECIADVRRSLSEGMEGGTGYIFSTSNCVYTGLPLERYELMHKIWTEEGLYK